MFLSYTHSRSHLRQLCGHCFNPSNSGDSSGRRVFEVRHYGVAGFRLGRKVDRLPTIWSAEVREQSPTTADADAVPEHFVSA